MHRLRTALAQMRSSLSRNMAAFLSSGRVVARPYRTHLWSPPGSPLEPKTWLETFSGNTTATVETKVIFKRNLPADGTPEFIPANDQVEREWVF
jgi:hypothetical protein